MDLLEEVVLLLTHGDVSTGLFLPLLELVLEGLCVDADAAVADNLLAGRARNRPRVAAHLAHPLHARVKGQQVVLQVDDFDVWLRQLAAHFAVQI